MMNNKHQQPCPWPVHLQVCFLQGCCTALWTLTSSSIMHPSELLLDLEHSARHLQA